MDLTGKVAIVTGSSRGIGQAIALRLAEAGASVAVNGTNQELVQSVAGQITATGRCSLAVVADVSSAAEVAGMIETVMARCGRIDVLVNNAGITRDGLVLRMSDEDWDRVLAVNLRSAFLCSRAVMRQMIKQRWGRIISISSVVGMSGNPGQANYTAAKAGIIGLTRTVAREVASRGITANAIAPGFIDTEMTLRLDEKRRESIKQQIPAGFFGTPRDVAEAVAFLASEEARYITGQVLSVDGGLAGGLW